MYKRQGYDSGVNKLRLFDIESIDESLVKKGIDFDKEAIEKNLTLFLSLIHIFPAVDWTEEAWKMALWKRN